MTQQNNTDFSDEENSIFRKDMIENEDVSENEENTKEVLEENTEEEPNENQDDSQELSPWEEFDSNDSVVKKYIVYISKDFVPIIDDLNTDERSAYINDAIQKKLDLDDIKSQKTKKVKILVNFLVVIITILITLPIALFLVNKAILLTFDNYKYSQDNFEKLYKHKYEKDKNYIYSIQYGKK